MDNFTAMGVCSECFVRGPVHEVTNKCQACEGKDKLGVKK